MDYSKQFTKLQCMLKESGNTNLIRDFFIQFQSIRRLDPSMILDALDSKETKKPPWLPEVSFSDIRNIVVFLMWKEFETMINARGDLYSEESKLGTKIEDLTVYLETKYYVNQIKDMYNNIHKAEPLSYIEWVKHAVEKKGLRKTIEAIHAML